LDSAGSLFIADTGILRVRKVGPEGVITSVAGNGQFESRGSDRADRAPLLWPEGLVLDHNGNLFIADTYNRQVRQVTPDGALRTVAGKERPDTGPIRFSGDGGPGPQAELSFPTGLAVDRAGNLFIADTENHRVRKVDPNGTITTITGTGTAGFSGEGSTATSAELNAPRGLALDRAGNLFIADSANHRVRKLTPDGTIVTVSGTGVPGFAGDGGAATNGQLNRPLGLAADSSGNLFIVDSLNYRIRRVSPDGTITTVFGSGSTGDGETEVTSRHYPSSVAVDPEGNLLIADPFHHRIWKVAGVATPGLIAGQPFPRQ
jgi:sugar lactone lactonase YvrE